MSKDCTSEYNNSNTSKVQNEAWLKTLFDIVNDFYTQQKKGLLSTSTNAQVHWAFSFSFLPILLIYNFIKPYFFKYNNILVQLEKT